MEAAEVWRPIPGHAPYEVSTLGRVRRRARVLKPFANSNGYLRVSLSAKRARRVAFVHVLVLEAFVGPCPPGMEARHVHDRDPRNCCLWNLAWGTDKQNGSDRVRHGSTPLKDLTGQVFGSLTVICRTAASKNTPWHCRCACGGGHVVRGDLLRSGRVTHCRACGGARAGVGFGVGFSAADDENPAKEA